jgi:hypothetical protein
MPRMSDDLMERARRALREERQQDAQAILINVIARQPEDDEAWLLLAEALTDAAKQRECLERARIINPSNPAILRALERIHPVSTEMATAVLAPPPSAEPTASEPVPKTAAEAAAPAALPTSQAVVADSTSEDADSAAFDALLEDGAALAQKLMLTMDHSDTHRVGLDLIKILERAIEQDDVNTRRWARTAGRGALVKYEKALSNIVAGLTRDDPQLALLLEQRQRALAYLR